MPWVTPTLEQLRATNQANVTAQLRSGPMIPNSVLRVMADSNAGLAYLTLLYINWLALQLMPDTAETEWLDRYANIWRPGGVARKTATYASAVIQVTGISGTILPAGTIWVGAVDTTTGATINFATTSLTVVGIVATNVSVVALSPGATGLIVGSQLSLQTGIAGMNGVGTVSSIIDGVEQETDDELRARILFRIQEPPMGGDANDYVAWALAQPGVTRAWVSPMEMGIGTVTVRFMMDDLRAGPLVLDGSNNVLSGGGFPTATDVMHVAMAMQLLRPVTVKVFYALAPLAYPINFTIQALVDGTGTAGGSVATHAAIVASVTAMLAARSSPAYALNGVSQTPPTIYAAWVSEAILSVPSVQSFDLVMADLPMPGNGYLAVLGVITYT